MSDVDAARGDTTDEALAASVMNGERQAFATLVERHEAALFRYARALTADDAVAEDAVQQTFLALWTTLSTRRPAPERVRGWLFTTLRHAVYRAFRRRSGQPRVHDDVAALGLAAGFGEDSPEATASLREERELLDRALALLDVELREVIVLHDIEGFAGADVARLLELTLPAMKSRLHRARLKLLARVRELVPEVRHEG